MYAAATYRALGVGVPVETRYKWFSAAQEAFRRGQFHRDDLHSAYETRADLYLPRAALMDTYYARHMGSAWRDLGQTLPTPTFPLIGSVVGSKAVAFRERPIYRLYDTSTGETVDDASDLAERLPRMLEDDGIPAAFERADSLSVAHKTTAVWIRLRSDGRLKVETTPPYCLDVTRHPEEPGDVEHALSITVPALGDACPDPEVGDDEARITYAYYPGVGFFAGYVDRAGEPAGPDLPEAPGGILAVQRHPVVIWREEDAAHPFAPPAYSLHDAQVEVNLCLARMTLAVYLGAHGMLTFERAENAHEWPAASSARTEAELDAADGIENANARAQTLSNVVQISGSIHEALQIPTGQTAKLIQPQADIYSIVRWIESIIKRAYIAEDMIPGRIDLQTPQQSNVSGRAKLVEAQPHEGAKQRREGRLARQAIKTLRVWRDFHNLTLDRTHPEYIPEHFDFEVTFKSLPMPGVIYDQSAMQGLTEALSNGAADPIAVRADLDGTTYRIAKRAYYRGQGHRARADALRQRTVNDAHAIAAPPSGEPPEAPA